MQQNHHDPATALAPMRVKATASQMPRYLASVVPGPTEVGRHQAEGRNQGSPPGCSREFFDKQLGGLAQVRQRLFEGIAL